MPPKSLLRRSLPGCLLHGIVVLAPVLALALIGCRGGVPGDASPSGVEQQRQLNNEVRAQMEQIPPPVKSKFATVHDLRQWQNPFLTVQDSMLLVHVTLADPNTSDLGVGGMLRPAGARRQDLSVRVSELAPALNAIPPTAWPYGRVIAVEEAHGTPKSAEPQVRRTMEGVMRTLSDLGVVVYEWGDNGPELR